MDISYIPNPRNENDENELHVSNNQFLGHGLQPITLHKGLIDEVSDIVRKYAGNCNLDKIPCVSYWNKNQQMQAIDNGHETVDSNQ